MRLVLFPRHRDPPRRRRGRPRRCSQADRQEAAAHCRQGRRLRRRAGRFPHRECDDSAPKGTGVSGTAVVHFASGDVSFDLAQVRKSLTLRARTAVGAEEATGPVMIDVTLYAGGLAFVRTVSVDIVEPAPVL